jgi:hypothetical protein
MAVNITASLWNVGVFTGVFGGDAEAIIVIERDSGTYCSISSAIHLGSLSMTLLQSNHNDDYLIAIWGAVVPTSLIGTSYSMVRTKGTYGLTHSVDVIKLSGVSSDMLYAGHNVRINVATATNYSHQIATKRGGMVIDYLSSGGSASPGAGQSNVFTDPRPKASYKANTITGLTGMSWTWEASRATYVCVSIKPKIPGGGAMGVL